MPWQRTGILILLQINETYPRRPNSIECLIRVQLAGAHDTTKEPLLNRHQYTEYISDYSNVPVTTIISKKTPPGHQFLASAATRDGLECAIAVTSLWYSLVHGVCESRSL